jgi:hypothetical protein
MIDGSNIANILFDPSAQTIKATDEGTKALSAALQAYQEGLDNFKGSVKRKVPR